MSVQVSFTFVQNIKIIVNITLNFTQDFRRISTNLLFGLMVQLLPARIGRNFLSLGWKQVIYSDVVLLNATSKLSNCQIVDFLLSKSAKF